MLCHIEDMSDRYQASVFSGRKLMSSSPVPYLKIIGIFSLYVTTGKHSCACNQTVDTSISSANLNRF